MLNVLHSDYSVNHELTKRTLSALELIGSNLDDYLHLITPVLMKLLEQYRSVNFLNFHIVYSSSLSYVFVWLHVTQNAAKFLDDTENREVCSIQWIVNRSPVDGDSYVGSIVLYDELCRIRFTNCTSDCSSPRY